MKNKSRSEWLSIGGGIVLIVIYSIAMIVYGGDAPWAWLLLLGGIVLLAVSSRWSGAASGRRDDSS